MSAPKKVAGRRANAPGPAQDVQAPMHAQRSAKRAYGSGSIYEHHALGAAGGAPSRAHRSSSASSGPSARVAAATG